MSESKNYTGYVEDLIPIIWDMITDAREEEPHQLFAGDLWVYYQTLSFLQQELAYHNIQLQPMGMKDVGNVDFVYEQVPTNIHGNEFKSIIQSLVSFLRNEEQRIIALDHTDNDFVMGQIDGIYALLSMMQQQATLAFELPLDELDLVEVELKPL